VTISCDHTSKKYRDVPSKGEHEMHKQKMIMVSFLLILFVMLITIVPRTTEAATAYADGEYTIPLEILKDTSDEISATSEYMVSPAKLRIENGKIDAVVTLNNSSWWQYFKTQSKQSNSFSDVSNVSEDIEKDTRIIKFEVPDLEQPLHAKIHIIVTGIPGFVYDNKYDIRLKFDPSGIPAAKELPEAEAKAEPEPEPEAKAELGAKAEPEVELEKQPPIPQPKAEPDTDIATQIEKEETKTEQQEPVIENEATENITEQIADPADDQPVENIAAEPVEQTKTSSLNKAVLFSIIALGLLALLFILFRARKLKK
jgi:heme-binding NEAT domain protein